MECLYLAHHGVKGQKWGVRRYQNQDGSLTEEGRRRYSKSSESSVDSDKFKKNIGTAVKVASTGVAVAGLAAATATGMTPLIAAKGVSMAVLSANPSAAVAGATYLSRMVTVTRSSYSGIKLAAGRIRDAVG